MTVLLGTGCGGPDDKPTSRESPTPTGAPQSTRFAYGDTSDNFGDLYLPNQHASDLPVIVMMHGGGWQQQTNLAYTEALAADLAAHGVAVWNIEYRRVGGAGGWPTTLADVDAATDALATIVRPGCGGCLNLDSVHVIGHSAGGHLAAWLAGRHTLDRPDAPGADPQVRLASATILAGVLDLRLAVTDGHDRYVRALLDGTPDERPTRYQIASPIEHLPIGLPVTVIHGDADTVVSVEHSRRYAAAARIAGDPVTSQILPGIGHADFADLTSPAWAAAKTAVLERINSRPR